jgi:hypothetical protein
MRDSLSYSFIGSPNRLAMDRIIAGLCTLFMRSARVLRSAIVLKPSTLLHLHSVLRKRKYCMLFSPGHSASRSTRIWCAVS